MRPFLSWRESVERIQTDDEGLRQWLACGGWRKLRGYVRAESRSFLGTLDGEGVALSGDHEGLRLASRWDNDEPTRLTNGKTLDAWAGGDDACDWEKTESPHWQTGYSAVYTLSGFLAVMPWCVKVAAVEGAFDGVGVTPPSWWSREDAAVPLRESGEPSVHFYLLDDGVHQPPPRTLGELWFASADVGQVIQTAAAGELAHATSHGTASENIEPEFIEARRRGGRARHATDPKTKAKTEALKLWQERRAGKHPKLRTNEQFAIECMRRWPVLTSAKVICGWCTDWNKAAKKPQPAS